MFEIITLGIAVAGAVLAFGFSRGFVRRRLRFVDAVQSPVAPFAAGLLGAVVAWPFTLLPLISGLTAALVGLGTGLGTASGIKALKRGE
jgi:hypothetical protein